jgi:hypothetical protein
VAFGSRNMARRNCATPLDAPFVHSAQTLGISAPLLSTAGSQCVQ